MILSHETGYIRASLACLLAWTVALSGWVEAKAATKTAPTLAMASPEWRDQIIYFLLTDRFDDGDLGNDDQHAGEFAAADPARYNGGDLAGIQRRLDYIRGLGATALWITPPVANRWWDEAAQHGGYHGYWAENFVKVDAHLGGLADYQRLSGALHDSGMFLIQDIVLNHTGNWFDYDASWQPGNPASGFKLLPDSRGHAAPSQWPFSMNDPRDPAQRALAVYHWTPRLGDFRDPLQVSTYQMGGLDDLNSESPLVRAALRKSYGYWIRAAGVDAFRIDTAFYVTPASLDDFMHSSDPENPGMVTVAAGTGRSNFHVFGEGFAIDKPYQETQALRIEALTRTPNGQTLLPGMINYPLYGSIGDVFARGHPAAEMAYRIQSMMRVHAHPELMPTFIDNHDVERFLATGSPAGLKQALLLLMTLPGIPTLYYGTEQGFTVARAAMFQAGSDSGGIDHFDRTAPLYVYTAAVAALRHVNRVFSRGRPTVLKANSAGPGVLAYTMDDGADSALVVLNTGEREALLDNLATPLKPDTHWQGLFSIDGAVAQLATNADGLVNLRLPPRSGQVWRLAPGARTALRKRISIRIDPIAAQPVNDDFYIGGVVHGTGELQLITDGDVASAQCIAVDAQGRWRARVDTGSMTDARTKHSVVAWSQASGVASNNVEFTVAREWKTLARHVDPVGDDRGTRGRYEYPLDAGWRAHHQADIHEVEVAAAGNSLRVSVRMNEITTLWNPLNGFDHVAFTVFLQVPGATPTAAVMPLQNSSLPAPMRWNYRLRAHGWSSALFSATGASAVSEGSAVAPTPTVIVDTGSNTVSFVFAGVALGRPHTLSGTKIYVSTWDFDAGMRPLAAQAGPGNFGGGDGANDPLVMDDIAVITLP